MLTHDSAETEGLDIPVLTTSSRLDVSTLNLRYSEKYDYMIFQADCF